MAKSARGLYQGYRVKSIDDVKVFAGIKLESHANTTTKVLLRKTRKLQQTLLSASNAPSQQSQERPCATYKCSVSLTSERPNKNNNSTAPRVGPTLMMSVRWTSASSMYDGTHYGRHFQMLEKVLNVSSSGITIKCKRSLP